MSSRFSPKVDVVKMRGAKTILAKLLATENIQIRHSVSAATASFDIEKRILTLPVFKDMEAFLYDMLVGHEVGHSLWTLFEEWREALDVDKINKGILNIVEDARIEKKIKRLYPGITRDFIRGYRDLVYRGFFGVIEYSELNFIDRINLHFKCGDTAAIPFTSEERPYVKLVADVETFDEAKEVAKILQIAYAEDATTQMDDLGCGFPQSGGSAFDDNADESESEDFTDGDEEETNITMPNAEDFDPQAHDADDEEFTTDSTWEEKKRELTENSGDEYQYFTLPTPNFKNMIVSPKKILEELPPKIKNFYIEQPWGETYMLEEFAKFRNSSQKIINYMVKEFERKKAAQVYRRASISKTGVLDVNKLFSYKYNDDLFLKHTIMPDGKNHGLVMMLDWSASMDQHMHDTTKQLLSLVWFCQKVNIPFEVFAFTATYRHMTLAHNGEEVYDTIRNHMTWKFKGGDARVDDLHLLHFFSNKMRSKQINEMAKWLFAYSCPIQKDPYYYRTPMRHGMMGGYGLSSTPLVEGLIAMQAIIPQFQTDNKLDVVNFINLTDGDGNSSFFSRVKEDGQDSGRVLSGYGVAAVFFDPKTYRVYKLDDFQYEGGFTRNEGKQELFLLKLLKDRYGINLIGIYLESSSNTIRQKTLEKYLGWRTYNREAYQLHRKQGRKDGFITLKNAGYDEYYLVPTGKIKISDTDHMEFLTGTESNGKIKTAFTKNLNQKFGNRVLINRIVELIC